MCRISILECLAATYNKFLIYRDLHVWFCYCFVYTKHIDIVNVYVFKLVLQSVIHCRCNFKNDDVNFDVSFCCLPIIMNLYTKLVIIYLHMLNRSMHDLIDCMINWFLFSIVDIHSMVQLSSAQGRNTNRKHRRGLSKWLETYVITWSDFWRTTPQTGQGPHEIP